jgi:competence protein ComEC
VSAAAQAGTGPLVVTYFGQLAPISLLANLLVVPLMGASVALGLISAILASCAGPAATLVNGANWLVLKGAIGAAELLSRPSWACVEVARPTATGTALYLCLLCLIVPGIRRLRVGRCLPVALLVLGNFWVWGGIFNRPSGLEILVLDVGQGDSIFLRFPNGRTMIVDGGDRLKGMDTGERVLLPFLRYRGIRRIDVVVGSHPHNDHIGGLVTLLEQVEVGHYLDAGQHCDTWAARRIRELIREKSIVYHQLAAGDSLAGLGGVGAVVLHPSPDYVRSDGRAPRGLNNTSIVMRLAYNGHALLLTGDVEREADRDLLRWTDRLRADVLKAAHHGSPTSSTEAFLRGVRPALAVVSCGAGNKFGHPAPSVIRRYDEMGISARRTDVAGAIRVDVNGEEIRVSGWID